ncbi:MAG TPA: hypothetical protein VF618_16335 [Thermoanaerobaculia bacterium]
MDFAAAWAAAARFRKVSPELEAYVLDVQDRAAEQPAQLGELREALERLLIFLASRAGRTDANVCSVDAFFSAAEGSWPHLPEDYRQVLEDLGGALHDSIYQPQIARTMGSLPEQLLARVRELT